MGEEVNVDPCLLLENLEKILDSDPHIDEVGFIHPAQFAAFNREVCNSPSSSTKGGCQVLDEITQPKPGEASSFSNFFWHREHKLGISTHILFLLYNAAKDAFLSACRRYRNSLDENLAAGIEVMKHSRALLVLSCDYGTAWNSRKMIILKKRLLPMLMDELRLSALVLSYSPKSERTWSHRRWVIKMIAESCDNLNEIVEKESQFVKTIVENFKMNYRAWSHRCWLVSYMSYSQLLHELENSRTWAGLRVADNSCYHYRVRLLMKIVENIQPRSGSYHSSCSEFHQLLKEELDWVAILIRQYVGREALWLHRRFLSLIWGKHLTDGDDQIPHCNSGSDHCDDISRFVKDEIMFVEACSVIPDNDFEDHKAQAIHSATYIAWLAKQMPDCFLVQLQKSSHHCRMKMLMNEIGKGFLLDSI